VISLAVAEAAARIEPALGGRVASLVIAGRERLVTGGPGDDPMGWGSYPMVPWAGRVRHGRFRFAGREHQLPLGLPPHAIHGTGYRAAWTVEGDGALRHDFGPEWPFGGCARQRFTLDAAGLTCTLEVHADRMPMPATIGWHPWFARPVELTFSARSMYRRDGAGIPDGTLVAPGPRPWDDCFTGVDQPPRLTWDDGVTLTMTSSCDHWVVFDELDRGLCVEPQSGPPDAWSLPGAERHVVEPGRPLAATMRLSWS
jgi:aldose 1-epimerase